MSYILKAVFMAGLIYAANAEFQPAAHINATMQTLAVALGGAR